MFRVLAVLLTLAALYFPAEAAKRVALVIGNGAYQHVTPLINPTNDSALMEQVLKESGFEVMRQDNLSKDGMKRAMVEFGRKLKEGAEAGMFYYAGHGVEVDGKNYLIPVDSDTQSKDEISIFNFDVNEFLALMENSGVPFNIIVLDACRNNPFRSLRATGGGLAPVNAPVGSYVAYATAPGAVAADGEGDNSPFTLALSESIRTPGLVLEDVFKQTRKKVRAVTKDAQRPFDSSAIEGNFYFNSTPARPITAISADRELNAKEAFTAAGNDMNMLKIVAEEFSTTTWGKLAAGRVKTAEETGIEKSVLPRDEKFDSTISSSTDEKAKLINDNFGVEVPKLGLNIGLLGQRFRAAFNIDASVNGVVVTRVNALSDAANKGLLPGDVLGRIPING